MKSHDIHCSMAHCDHFAGTKSTENLSKEAGLEEDVDAGFRKLSPMPLVPRGEPLRGRRSPGSEMLTLEQFLKEANKDAEVSASPKDKVSVLFNIPSR